MKIRVFLLLALSLLATSVFAHSKAEETTPANDATVQDVEMIEIRFDDPMRVTAIGLKGPDGNMEIERETGFDPVHEFRAYPKAPMPAGQYQVEWRGLSSDGHPMQGTFRFTLSE